MYKPYLSICECRYNTALHHSQAEMDEDVYQLFDEFSSIAAENYTPERNMRAWKNLKALQPKIGWYTLKKIAAERR